MEYGGLPVINGIEEVEKLADLAEKATNDKETKLDVELNHRLARKYGWCPL